MKKILLNISDCDFEKLKFEAIEEKKSIQEIIKQRIWNKPFSLEVIQAFEKYIEESYQKILKD